MDFSLLEERIRNSYRYITKNKARDNEDDCVQEVLLSYWQNGKGQTVEQAVIDFLRKYGSGRKGTKNYECRLNLLNATEIPDSLAAENVSNFEFDQFSSIDPRVKEIVSLHIEGYTQEEIATKMGISRNMVRTTFRNFREKMQIISLLSGSVRKWVINHVF